MLRIWALMAALLFAGAAFAHDFRLGGVTIDHPWSRATPPGAKVAAGYLQIVNTSDAPVTLIGAEADFADVQLHTMEVEGGMMRMAEVEGGITVAPGETVTFAPGGLHIMFMNIAEPFAEGEVRTATLDFGDAGTVVVEFNVGGMGETHHHAQD